MWVVLVVPILIMMMALGMEGVESRLGIESDVDPNEPEEFLPGFGAAAVAASTVNVPTQDRRPKDRRPEGRRSRDARLRDARVHDRRLQDTVVFARPRSTTRVSGALRVQ
jgi:hypothetical protein